MNSFLLIISLCFVTAVLSLPDTDDKRRMPQVPCPSCGQPGSSCSCSGENQNNYPNNYPNNNYNPGNNYGNNYFETDNSGNPYAPYPPRDANNPYNFDDDKSPRIREYPASQIENSCECNINTQDPCNGKVARIYNRTSTPVYNENTTQFIRLECAPGSYYDALEYLGTFETSLTCTGFLDIPPYNTDIIVGRRNTTRGIVYETIYGYYSFATANNNGNTIQRETAKITNPPPCQGGSIRAVSNWVATDPLTGCCGNGVNLITGTSYDWEIFGRCASRCYLVEANWYFTQPIRN